MARRNYGGGGADATKKRKEREREKERAIDTRVQPPGEGEHLLAKTRESNDIGHKTE